VELTSLLPILLPVLAFVALAAGLFVVFRRADRIVARTREVGEFREAVGDLVSRIDVSLEGATGQIDAVRHHVLPPAALADTLTAATDAVERYLVEARALTPPPRAFAIRVAIVNDLERAARALAMVEHGATLLVSVRRGNRELEGQTSMKRGYLNLLHAREALARHAALADDLETTGTDQEDVLGRTI
jgi:hypothetical protein